MNEQGEFVMSGDGWVQVSPMGEYPHKGAGVTQVIDAEACEKMATDFAVRREAAGENFAGLLVDFDHFSLDTDKPSEAAAWITELEARADGLWARVRWSDSGLSAVKGGRYKLLSPVFRYPGGTEDLGEGRVRPIMLDSVALTNEPNIKGGRPVANRKPAEAAPAPYPHKNPVPRARTLLLFLDREKSLANRAARLGAAAALADRERKLMNRFSSVPSHVTDDRWTEGGRPASADDFDNRWSDEARASARRSRKANGNYAGWTDEARAASLAARRAKAKSSSGGGGSGGSSSGGSPVPGGYYPDGTRVIRDMTDLSDWVIPEDDGRPYMREGDTAAKRQADYEEAFRQWWDGVEVTSGNIDKFNEFVASFLGSASAAAGAPRPGGAASRAFGASSGGSSRSGAGRRGVIGDLVRGALRKMREKGNDVTENPETPPSVGERFGALRADERASLAQVVHKLMPSATGLENLGAEQLRYILETKGFGRAASEVPEARPGYSPKLGETSREAFNALRDEFGVDVSKLKTPGKFTQASDPKESRAELGDYLFETFGHRPGNVDDNLKALETEVRTGEKFMYRLKQDMMRANLAVSEAKSKYGKDSPEYEKAMRLNDNAVADYAYGGRAVSRRVQEYNSTVEALRRYQEIVHSQAGTFNPADSDYNALLYEMRQASDDPLVRNLK